MENEDKILIEKLVALGLEHAGKHLRESGQMPALFYGFSEENNVMLRPHDLDDGKDRMQFMTIARLICIAHDLEAVAFVAWVWSTKMSQDEPPDTPPGESFYRQECVVISCETRNGILQPVLIPIIRADNGAFFGLGEPQYSDPGSTRGQFSPFMPSQRPTDADRKRAHDFLLGLTHQPPENNN